MANNIKDVLQDLSDIDGYIGACVVDVESAMALGTHGGSGALNLEIAAAGNAEVIKSKYKTMKSLGLRDEIEDILISLGLQYHLIRPLQSRKGIFLYIALNRSQANLAMARLLLKDAENKLQL